MSFKSGFESRESRSLTEQVVVSSKSEVRQCWTIVWRMMSVEMARAVVGRMKGGFTLCCGPTLSAEVKTSSATVWNVRLSEVSRQIVLFCRVEVQLLCRLRWSSSDWRETYEFHPNAVFLDERRWQGSGHRPTTCECKQDWNFTMNYCQF